MLTPIAFQALIVTIRLISAPISASLNCSATSSYASVGTWSLASSVTASVKAERRALALGEERSLSPCAERVQTLLGLADRARVLRVHVDAVGAAVDLRGSDSHQLAQGRVELDLVELLGRGVIEVGHGLGEVGRMGVDVESDRNLVMGTVWLSWPQPIAYAARG